MKIQFDLQFKNRRLASNAVNKNQSPKDDGNGFNQFFSSMLTDVVEDAWYIDLKATKIFSCPLIRVEKSQIKLS